MKIAIVSTLLYEPWGGSEVLWSQMSKLAVAAGHEVFAMAYQPTGGIRQWNELRSAGIAILPPPRGSGGGGGWYRLVNRAIDRVADPYRAFVDVKPDVVLINQSATYDVAVSSRLQPLVAALDRGGIRYMVICHMTDDHYFPNQEVRELTDRYFTNAAIVAFVAGHNQRVAQRQLGRVLPQSLVIRNPVNLTDRTPVPWPGVDAMVQAQLASVGRLDVSAKGQDVLLESLANRSGDWKLNFYGSGADEAYLKSLVKFYGLVDRVNFAGHVSNIRQVWADNHLLVMPSRFEGTPLALVEAMLCGRPALVTRVGGNTEWITDPDCGFIAEAPTPESVSVALDRAFAARTAWPKMGIAAHAAAMRLYDPSPEQTLLSLLQRAVAK